MGIADHQQGKQKWLSNVLGGKGQMVKYSDKMQQFQLMAYSTLTAYG